MDAMPALYDINTDKRVTRSVMCLSTSQPTLQIHMIMMVMVMVVDTRVEVQQCSIVLYCGIAEAHSHVIAACCMPSPFERSSLRYLTKPKQ